MEIITNLRVILLLLLIFSHGVTKDPKENDYLLVFEYAANGDLHNNLSKNFKEITWQDKIRSLCDISQG